MAVLPLAVKAGSAAFSVNSAELFIPVGIHDRAFPFERSNADASPLNVSARGVISSSAPFACEY